MSNKLYQVTIFISGEEPGMTSEVRLIHADSKEDAEYQMSCELRKTGWEVLKGKTVELGSGEIPRCPYCGSDDIGKELNGEFAGHYICNECEWMFDEEDIEREDIRHRVSAILMDTDEEHPMECDIIVGEREAQGLSGLELPNIVKCYQIPGDGTIWFHEYGAIEFDENGGKKERWMNFDDFDIYDLRVILEELENEQ